MTTTFARSPAARRAGHRGAVLGLRQLRHPVQGVRQPGTPARPSRRRSPTPLRCTGSPAWRRPSRCTSRGTSSTTSPRCSAYAEDLGVGLGTINSNTFQDDDYKLGSLTNADPKVRRKAVEHNLDCIEIMNETGSRDLKIWLADGTNYPGQGDIRARQDWLAEGLRRDLRADRRRPAARAGVQVLRAGVLPHRRPGLGHVVRARAPRSGSKAMVCLDTGHHAPGTNIEFIVAQLLRLGKLGSFDFNSRFYADDDLIVGAADPFQLFRIMVEVVRGGGFGAGSDVALMLDQCHNIETKVPGQIRSVLNVQEMTARALLLDTEALAAARSRRRRARGQRDLHGRVLHRRTPLTSPRWREERGLPGRPDARPTSPAATRSRSRRTASAAPRQDGTDHDRQTPSRPSSRADRAVQPARRRPPQHQLRRRQHLRQGHRRPTRSPARPSSCCGSRAPAATSAP